MIGKNGVSLLIGHNGVQDKTTLNPANEVVARGIYDATTLSVIDADLATGNIKNGITIFGFVGSADVHDISDATAVEAEVLAPETFYAVSGGIRTGTMPIEALDPALNEYPAGYHAGAASLTAVDAQLVTGSIKYGITIFGVAGHTNVRDSSDANATATRVRSGYTFYAGGGARKTGTLPTRTLSPDNDTVLAGYYAATNLSTVDAHLAAGNIKDGVTIFGVLGTLEVAVSASNLYKISNWRAIPGTSYTTIGSGLVPAAALVVVITAAVDSSVVGDEPDARVTYNGVQKAEVLGTGHDSLFICTWEGDGLGSAATAASQIKSSDPGYTVAGAGCASYIE